MGLSITHQAKPISGVTVSEIPRELIDAMTEEWAFIKTHPDHEVVLTADNPAEAQQFYLYARAWGNGHDPRLVVRKLPARPKQNDNEVRFTVKLFEEDAPQPGRPAAPAPADIPADVPADVPPQASSPESPAPIPPTPASTMTPRPTAPVKEKEKEKDTAGKHR